jgi:hypothetical protein
MLKRISRMQLALCLNVGGMSFFCRQERPQINRLSFNANFCAKAVLLFDYAHDTKTIATARVPLVLAVECVRHFSQVGKPIVVTNAVNVVNLLCGPHSGEHQPNKAMRTVGATIDANDSVALRIGEPGKCAYSASRAARHFPPQQPFLRIVREKLMQVFRGHLISITGVL